MQTGIIRRSRVINSAFPGLSFARTGGSPYLIDNLSVSPIGAFSTRKLRGAYSGNALLASQSNTGAGSTDLAIGFTGGGDLDNTAMTTFSGAGNDCWVRTWYDQSGNGYDLATNSGDVRRPRTVVAGTTQQTNGHTWVQCQDGVSNMAFPLTPAQPYTVVAVQKAQGNKGVVILTDNGAEEMGPYSFAVNSVPQLVVGVVLNASVAGDTNLHSIAYIANSTNSQIIRDGTQVALGDAGTGIMPSLLWAACPVNSVGELLIFTSVLSPADIALIIASHQSYWGTP
jgi:hypothetical protein